MYAFDLVTGEVLWFQTALLYVTAAALIYVSVKGALSMAEKLAAKLMGRK